MWQGAEGDRFRPDKSQSQCKKNASLRSADRLLGGKSGTSEAGKMDGGGPMSPGGSPLYPGPDKRDSRRTILLNLTYLNLFLALVLLILGAAGPAYPGHSGTTDNAYTDGVSTREELENVFTP